MANTNKLPFVVTVRFRDKDRTILHHASEIEGVNLSTFLRRAALKELARMNLLSKDDIAIIRGD